MLSKKYVNNKDNLSKLFISTYFLKIVKNILQ